MRASWTDCGAAGATGLAIAALHGKVTAERMAGAAGPTAAGSADTDAAERRCVGEGSAAASLRDREISGSEMEAGNDRPDAEMRSATGSGRAMAFPAIRCVGAGPAAGWLGGCTPIGNEADRVGDG